MRLLTRMRLKLRFWPNAWCSFRLSSLLTLVLILSNSAQFWPKMPNLTHFLTSLSCRVIVPTPAENVKNSPCGTTVSDRKGSEWGMVPLVSRGGGYKITTAKLIMQRQETHLKKTIWTCAREIADTKGVKWSMCGRARTEGWHHSRSGGSQKPQDTVSCSAHSCMAKPGMLYGAEDLMGTTTLAEGAAAAEGGPVEGGGSWKNGLGCSGFRRPGEEKMKIRGIRGDKKCTHSPSTLQWITAITNEFGLFRTFQNCRPYVMRGGPTPPFSSPSP